MINGVSAASESSARIRSPMEFPWLLYWISFKFVTLSGTMLIAGRYESSRFKRSSFIIRRVASIQRIHVQLPSPRISAMLSVYHIPFASLRDHQPCIGHHCCEATRHCFHHFHGATVPLGGASSLRGEKRPSVFELLKKPVLYVGEG